MNSLRVFLALAGAVMAGPAFAADERDMVPTPRAGFLVRVDVDKPDRVYREGDKLVATVKSERGGYLYLVNVTADGRTVVIFPNKFQKDNRIEGNATVRVPTEKGDDFDLTIQGPKFGHEFLYAVVTPQPVDQLSPDKGVKAAFAVKALTQEKATEIPADVFKDAVRDIVPAARPRTDAEHRHQAGTAAHYVRVLTLRKGEPVPANPNLQGQQQEGPARKRRVGVFVGVSKYKNGIHPLKVAHLDAAAMAKYMLDHCGLHEAKVLTNEQATLAAIRELLQVQLPKATQAGDEVFIFWSGHGGRVADTTGVEPDGLSEFLVPYDGKVGTVDERRDSMLLDRTFATWVQALDGRKVVIILDACHSAGLAAGVKGLGETPTGLKRDLTGFFDRAFESIKNIDQKECAVFASSKATEFSLERKEGDLSVMTYFLLERLKDSKSVTLKEGFEYVERKVPQYVRETFRGGNVSQTPVLKDRTSPPMYLKP